MPITSTHPQYDATIARWKRCRDAYEGEDAVKAAGEAYLPKMSSKQPQHEYASYVARASFYEAVGRTVDGFVGAIARKPHTFTLPGRMAALKTDATGDGVGLSELTRALLGEDLLEGRFGILVEMNEVTQTPFFNFYRAETIINWSDSRVVLAETAYEPDPDDALDTIAVSQFRELKIEDGKYTVSTWRKVKAENSVTEKWAIVATVVPVAMGKRLTSLPFFWCSTLGCTSRITKPPLLGLVNVAMSHYRSSADLEHGRHFAGRPTLYITGWEPDGDIHVGGASALIIKPADAKVGYAEFTGQGLQSLETALASKEQQIAAMGAAAFAKGAARSEPVVTAEVRASGETSLLAGVTAAVEETLNAALKCAAEWSGAAGEVSAKLNRDFAREGLDPQTLMGLIAALQIGAIDLPSFLYCLDQSDMLAPTGDYIELAKQLQSGLTANLAAARKSATTPAASA